MIELAASLQDLPQHNFIKNKANIQALLGSNRHETNDIQWLLKKSLKIEKQLAYIRINALPSKGFIPQTDPIRTYH